MFNTIRGKVDMRVAFTVTVSKIYTTIRIVQHGEIAQTVKYPNVKSADDLMKLVSFYDAQFVDPMLKDYEVIKSIFGK
jgi:hypothetical protein